MSYSKAEFSLLANENKNEIQNECIHYAVCEYDDRKMKKVLWEISTDKTEVQSSNLR